jgi:polyribonucleotide nucleotidyltransferase
VTALPEVAGEILNQIEGSPVWNSEYLALERLQLNLDEEFTQITRVCRKLESMREMIKSHKGSNFDDPALRSELKFRKTAYAEAYAVVERRVATLYAYYIRLGEVENIIKQLDAASELRDTRNAFDDLLSEVALSELATAHVENLEAQLQFIRVNVVNNPYLDRPLALQN